MADQRPLEEPTPDGEQQTPLEESAPGYIALPYVLGFWTFAVLLGLILAPGVDLSILLNPRSGELRLLGLAMQFPFIVCVIAGILVHFRPNHSRELKYSLIMAGFPLLSLFLVPRSILDAVERAPAAGISVSFLKVALLFCAIFWSVLLVSIMAVLGGMWIRRQASNSQSLPRAWEQLLFTVVHMRYAGPLIVVCYFFSKDLMLVLLMIRYLTVERFRRTPVVYLRSFHYDDAAEVFGDAIAPALAPFGVVKGLVHSQQTGGALFSRTSIWQLGLMATVPDARWRDWVTKALRSATLVIVDSSVATESVIWEISAALHYVGQRCVLIITADQAPINTIGDVELIKYGKGGKAMKRLRRDIAGWAGRALPSGRSRLVLVAIVVWSCVLLLAIALFLSQLFSAATTR
jgi:hypothetical protein